MQKGLPAVMAGGAPSVVTVYLWRGSGLWRELVVHRFLGPNTSQ